jgi:hypothetical protein
MLFFKKNRIRVPDYLEERINEILTDDGTFILEGFFDEVQEMLSELGLELADAPPNRDHFINHFIGTLLWLIKYRTLITAKNSPRKLAHLDLRFDIETPKAVDKLFERYDRDTIKESYDTMDTECKKSFTGELQKDKKPRFLISPIWAANLDPNPLRIAGRIFVNSIDHKIFNRLQDTGNDSRLESMMEERFVEFSQPAADSCKDIHFVWMLNRG